MVHADVGRVQNVGPVQGDDDDAVGAAIEGQVLEVPIVQ
jgi:hypothetical protein